MQKIIYTILFISGVFALALWIHKPINETNLLNSTDTSSTPLTVSSSPTSPFEINRTQHENASEQLNVSMSETNTIDCNHTCRDNIELLSLSSVLDDDKYEELLGRTDEIAQYLRENPAAKKALIEIASTTGGDKRSVIMAAFNKLDIDARRSLGDVLIESSDWHSRFDAISFLSQPDIMNEQVTQKFTDMLDIESEYYVRSSIIKAFNQPDKFSGNQDILNTLEQVVYNDEDNSVRGEALLTRIKLEKEPEAVFYDVFSAISSNEGDYQSYGFRALEQIIIEKKSNGVEISSDYQDKTKYLFEELMTPEYDDMPAELRKMADEIYERHF